MTDEPTELNEGHEVQALEATSIMASIFENHVLEQPFVQAYPQLKVEAESLCERINFLYQMIGAVVCDRMPS